ncbi:MAG TPA: MazG nucleotide pyrophosphohydrolase domain-containing protein [Acidimicrobiales bacterium]|nr:MazG nucleotide pyrophosphohydrolase domain-containing protein [Acidimicrobiales bacterium]
MFAAIYPHRRPLFTSDEEAKVYEVSYHLLEEIGEVSVALLERKVDNYRDELADVFSWLMSLANLAGLDLEIAFHRWWQEFVAGR